MNPVTPIRTLVEQSVQTAIETAIADPPKPDPQIRPSDHADYQANGILALAKAKKTNPRQLAQLVVEKLPKEAPFATIEVSGPGFINLNIQDQVLLEQAKKRLQAERLGIGHDATSQTVVIDYSQPNIAKEMHVGHLRSTIIGDALARTLGFLGHSVIRQNHIGDWGTQFGMLIQYLIEHPETEWQDADHSGVSRLNSLYQTARHKFDNDSQFADRARHRVVLLQKGDETTITMWKQIVAESKRYFNKVYQLLDVLLQDDDAVGESFYNDQLNDVAKELETSGIAVRSDGALCVFFDDIVGPEGNKIPLIVQKSDGGFGYAATDLAAIRHRVKNLNATRLLYAVDARQALHFKMVLTTARRAGWLPPSVDATHVAFGTVLGQDGKPFKTRQGVAVRLISLLEEAAERARVTVETKNPDLSQDALSERARAVGTGAVKYADLSTGRTRDYVFDLDRMVSLTGNTGVYLQYADARIQSILARASQDDKNGSIDTSVKLDPAERKLILALDNLGDSLHQVAEHLEPHRLCGYLYELAGLFSEFYEACPVIKAPTDVQRINRLALCKLTSATLRMGLSLMGIQTPERL